MKPDEKQLTIINDNDRIFKAVITADIADSQNEIIPVEEAENSVMGILKRGGILMDEHSNKQVGRMLNYEKATIQGNDGKDYTALVGTFQVYSDYVRDDMVWNGIKNGEKTGISIGGENFDSEQKSMKDPKILKKLQGFELSIVTKPANPLALITGFNPVAKSDITKEDVQKPFAGYKDFEDCVSQNKDKNDPQAYCATIMREVEDKTDTKKEDIDLTPPESAQNNAKKVLRWKEEHGDEVTAMTETGWRRARQLADGDSLSIETVRAMSQFARHEDNSEIDSKYEGEPWKDNGYVAWLGWGGDSGIEWAQRKVDEYERKAESSNKKYGEVDNMTEEETKTQKQDDNSNDMTERLSKMESMFEQLSEKVASIAEKLSSNDENSEKAEEEDEKKEDYSEEDKTKEEKPSDEEDTKKSEDEEDTKKSGEEEDKSEDKEQSDDVNKKLQDKVDALENTVSELKKGVFKETSKESRPANREVKKSSEDDEKKEDIAYQVAKGVKNPSWLELEESKKESLQGEVNKFLNY